MQYLTHHGQHQAAPHTLVATSMSGEIAIRLAHAATGQITHLVLLVGAIYNRAAFAVPFGPDFSAVIRRPHSWREADTLTMIAGYRGGLTLIRALDDAVIPFEIADLLAQAARAARFVRIIDVPGVDHRLSERMAQDQHLRQRIAGIILQLPQP